MEDGIVRLNNYISSSGICSRREADRLIAQSKVIVNGKIAEIGYSVNDGDVVEVNGQLISKKQEFVYIALNKPVGITCTTERNVRGNIIDFINFPERIFPIGRLDKPSEGLILLTSDGSIVNKILRSENKHEKEYLVEVDRKISPNFLREMSRGVMIFNPVSGKNVVTAPCRITMHSENSFKIILTQGLNRQIRRMCEALGYNVTKLKRIRIMNLTLKNLDTGKWRLLTKVEVDALIK